MEIVHRIALSADSLAPNVTLQVSFDLTNTGTVPGEEVAQGPTHPGLTHRRKVGHALPGHPRRGIQHRGAAETGGIGLFGISLNPG